MIFNMLYKLPHQKPYQRCLMKQNPSPEEYYNLYPLPHDNIT